MFKNVIYSYIRLSSSKGCSVLTYTIDATCIYKTNQASDIGLLKEYNASIGVFCMYECI